jgi:hypothetical protein
MSREIILANSDHKAIVHDVDFDFVNQFIWAEEDGYAVTYDMGERIEMGWLILNRAHAEQN